MPEIKLTDGKAYPIQYSYWSILKSEEASGLPMVEWSGSFKSIAAAVYAGIISSSDISFETLVKLMPIKQSEIREISEVCNRELSKEMDIKS